MKEKIVSFLKKYVNFDFKSTAIFILLTIVAVGGAYLCGVREIQENSLLENTQLVALFVGILFCLCPKNNKEYKVINILFALIIFLFFMREISYGRVFFAQIPDTHDFYPWSHYKYGYLAHVMVGIYIAGTVIYAICKKAFVKIWEAMQKTQVPFWNVVLLFSAIFVQLLAEKKLHDTVIEEMMELLMYCIIAYVVFKYNKSLREQKTEE